MVKHYILMSNVRSTCAVYLLKYFIFIVLKCVSSLRKSELLDVFTSQVNMKIKKIIYGIYGTVKWDELEKKLDYLSFLF